MPTLNTTVNRLLALLRDAPHLLAPLSGRCRSFHERWGRAAGARPPAGRWAGEWRSHASGRHGPLRCAIEVLDDRQWRATFHAGYARVFRACYTTELSAARKGPGWTFSGRSDLGRLGGGLYEYDGDATDHRLVARYRSRSDHGVFTLTRITGRDASPSE